MARTDTVAYHAAAAASPWSPSRPAWPSRPTTSWPWSSIPCCWCRPTGTRRPGTSCARCTGNVAAGDRGADRLQHACGASSGAACPTGPGVDRPSRWPTIRTACSTTSCSSTSTRPWACGAEAEGVLDAWERRTGEATPDMVQGLERDAAGGPDREQQRIDEAAGRDRWRVVSCTEPSASLPDAGDGHPRSPEPRWWSPVAPGSSAAP